jgi:hypothetical protein
MVERRSRLLSRVAALAPLGSLALLLAVACAGSDLQQGAVRITAESLAGQDLIGYRALRPSDFRAPKAPPEVLASKHTVGGYTCLTLVHDGPIFVDRVPGSAERYRAELVEVRFRAYMNRTCSWVNPQAPLPPEYVLEHEQIHFGIWELQARRLNARPDAIRREVIAVAASDTAAVEAAKAKLAALLERALDELRERNLAFDRETSLGYFPDRQKRWRQRVGAELEKR